jgi:hypothetical protein
MKMLVKFLRGSLPLSFTAILLMVLVYWMSGLFSTSMQQESGLYVEHSLIFNQSFSWFSTRHLIMWIFGVSVFVTVSLFILNLNSKYIFIQDRTFMPMLFFGLLAGFPSSTQIISPIALFSFFLLFSLNKIFNTYRVKDVLSNYYEAAFLIGLGSFFWLPGIVFFFPVLAGLTIFRQFIWREWTVAIVGFVSPFAFYQFYQLFFNNKPYYLFDAITNAFKTAGPYAHNLDKMQLVYIGFVAFLVFAGSIKLIQYYDSFKIRSRKIFIMFFWIFLTCGVGYWLVPGITLEILYICAIPISFLLTFYFTIDRNPTRFQSLLFTAFLVLAFVQAFL